MAKLKCECEWRSYKDKSNLYVGQENCLRCKWSVIVKQLLFESKAKRLCMCIESYGKIGISVMCK